MKSFFKQIFDYHHYFNQKLINEIQLHFNELPEKTFPLFCHVLNAHQIWNSRILNSTPFGVQQVHALDACQNIDNNNYSNTINILDSIDLEKIIHYKSSKGEQFSNSVQDILFHVANHSTHHKGQIIADFRRQNVTPLVTDYIFFKR